MCRHRRWQENDEDGIDSGGVPVIDMAATGKNIYRLREAAGLSVKDLQARMELASLQAIISIDDMGFKRNSRKLHTILTER